MAQNELYANSLYNVDKGNICALENLCKIIKSLSAHVSNKKMSVV